MPSQSVSRVLRPAVEEAAANALVAYLRLFERGRVELAYPRVLTLYAIRQVADGRRQGTELNIRDVSSKRCRLKKVPQLGRLEPSSLTGKPWMLQYIATPGSTACASLLLHLE